MGIRKCIYGGKTLIAAKLVAVKLSDSFPCGC